MSLLYAIMLLFSALQFPMSGKPKSVTVSEGLNAEFKCSFDGQSVVPSPSTVAWRFDNNSHSKVLEEVGDPNFLSYDLLLEKVSRSQAGTYQCEIRNEFGQIKSGATLTVECKLHLYVVLQISLYF